MTTYGQRLGAKNLDSRANWSEEVIDSPAMGMTNVVPTSPHPKDGRRRRAEILMRSESGTWDTVACAFYDGNGQLENYGLVTFSWSGGDSRINGLIKRYAQKVATLDCLSWQREHPLQSPWHSWLLLRPGDVEVI
jgi:hypothetical protein